MVIRARNLILWIELCRETVRTSILWQGRQLHHYSKLALQQEISFSDYGHKNVEAIKKPVNFSRKKIKISQKVTKVNCRQTRLQNQRVHNRQLQVRRYHDLHWRRSKKTVKTRCRPQQQNHLRIIHRKNDQLPVDNQAQILGHIDYVGKGQRWVRNQMDRLPLL
jgi:hypothetical protein